jgi:transcriptional regulator with XRE-family HTH domain
MSIINVFFNPALLTRAREEAGLSLPGLADRSGVPFQTVYAWERGLRTPKVDGLIRVADVLHRSMDDFFTRTGAPDEVPA